MTFPSGQPRTVAGDMVERVARALYANEKRLGELCADVFRAAGGSGEGILVEPWDECAEKFRTDARAAIEAMREPSAEMLNEGGSALVIHEGTAKVSRVAKMVWQDMIDAVLREPAAPNGSPDMTDRTNAQSLADTDAESDAALLSRLGDDASKWAAEFRRIAIRLGYSDMDEGWLISWFANAIEHSETVRRAAAPAPTGDDVERVAEALRREMSDEQWTFERLARAALAAMPERGRASIPSDDELGPENDVDFLAWFEQVNEAMPDSAAKTAMRRALKLSAAAETRGMVREQERCAALINSLLDKAADGTLDGNSIYRARIAAYKEVLALVGAAASQPDAQPDEVDKIIEEADVLARRIGMRFVPDPKKIAAFRGVCECNSPVLGDVLGQCGHCRKLLPMPVRKGSPS